MAYYYIIIFILLICLISQVKMIMATNRPDTLDPALLRPGRYLCFGFVSILTQYYHLDWIERSRSLCRTSKPAWRCSRSTPTPSQRYPHLCDLCLGLKEEHFYSKCVLSVPYCWVQSNDNKKIKHYLLFSQHGEIDFEAVVKLSDG